MIGWLIQYYGQLFLLLVAPIHVWLLWVVASIDCYFYGWLLSRFYKQIERKMIGWFNFTAGYFYGCLKPWMVGQRHTNRQAKRKRQTNRQTEWQTNRQREKEKQIDTQTDRKTGRQTDKQSIERKNDGWFVSSILWMVSSINGRFLWVAASIDG